MANSVLTIPIRTNQVQKDILDKRMNLIVTIYNQMLSNRLKALRSMENNEDYARATSEIKKAAYYKHTASKELNEKVKAALHCISLPCDETEDKLLKITNKYKADIDRQNIETRISELEKDYDDAKAALDEPELSRDEIKELKGVYFDAKKKYMEYISKADMELLSADIDAFTQTKDYEALKSRLSFLINEKANREITKNIMKQYDFSEFAFGKISIKYSKRYSTNISTTVAQKSIGVPMWTAFEKYFYGDGKTVSYKSRKNNISFASDCKSGLKLTDENGKTLFTRGESKDIYIISSATKGKKVIMPLMLDKKNVFENLMLERQFKIIRITRKWIRNRYEYYAQITVDGEPADKYDKNGNKKTSIGSGKVGIYIDSETITVAKDGNIVYDDYLCAADTDYDDKIKKLNVFKDRSARATNPERFNEDGTIKRFYIDENGNKQYFGKRWNHSKKYMSTVSWEKDLYRREAETRKINRDRLANLIISLGDDIRINKYNASTKMKNKVFDEVEEKKNSGAYRTKKGDGEKIRKSAPSTLISILKTKANTLNLNFAETEVKYDKSDSDYKKKAAIVLSELT